MNKSIHTKFETTQHISQDKLKSFLQPYIIGQQLTNNIYISIQKQFQLGFDNKPLDNKQQSFNKTKNLINQNKININHTNQLVECLKQAKSVYSIDIPVEKQQLKEQQTNIHSSLELMLDSFDFTQFNALQKEQQQVVDNQNAIVEWDSNEIKDYFLKEEQIKYSQIVNQNNYKNMQQFDKIQKNANNNSIVQQLELLNALKFTNQKINEECEHKVNVQKSNCSAQKTNQNSNECHITQNKVEESSNLNYNFENLCISTQSFKQQSYVLDNQPSLQFNNKIIFNLPTNQTELQTDLFIEQNKNPNQDQDIDQQKLIQSMDQNQSTQNILDEIQINPNQFLFLKNLKKRSESLNYDKNLLRMEFNVQNIEYIPEKCKKQKISEKISETQKQQFTRKLINSMNNNNKNNLQYLITFNSIFDDKKLEYPSQSKQVFQSSQCKSVALNQKRIDDVNSKKRNNNQSQNYKQIISSKTSCVATPVITPNSAYRCTPTQNPNLVGFSNFNVSTPGNNLKCSQNKSNIIMQSPLTTFKYKMHTQTNQQKILLQDIKFNSQQKRKSMLIKSRNTQVKNFNKLDIQTESCLIEEVNTQSKPTLAKNKLFENLDNNECAISNLIKSSKKIIVNYIPRIQPFCLNNLKGIQK